jgi:type IV pilus assembly protein PilQ
MPLNKAIRGVDFQRGTQGEGNVLIDLSDPSIAPDIQERDGKIIVGFARTQLPDLARASGCEGFRHAGTVRQRQRHG